MKYIKVRLPLEAYNNYKNKQAKMSTVLSKLTGKEKRIPLTRILTISSEQPIYLEDRELISKLKKRIYR